MAADCELDGCGVAAVGRCRKCGRAFCVSHQASTVSRSTTVGLYGQQTSYTQVPDSHRCSACASTPAPPDGHLETLNQSISDHFSRTTDSTGNETVTFDGALADARNEKNETVARDQREQDEHARHIEQERARCGELKGAVSDAIRAVRSLPEHTPPIRLTDLQVRLRTSVLGEPRVGATEVACGSGWAVNRLVEFRKERFKRPPYLEVFTGWNFVLDAAERRFKLEVTVRTDSATFLVRRPPVQAGHETTSSHSFDELAQIAQFQWPAGGWSDMTWRAGPVDLAPLLKRFLEAAARLVTTRSSP